jgi:hypothetical protein
MPTFSSLVSRTGAPVVLVKENGRVKPFGVTASTESDVGAALEAAVAASVAGNQILVNKSCTTSTTPEKPGVDIIYAPSAVLTVSGNLPAITPGDISTLNVAINVRREASIFAPEPEMCFLDCDFSTTNFASDWLPTYFASSVNTIGDGLYTFATSVATFARTQLRFQRGVPSSQLTYITRVESLNAAGTTSNEVQVGAFIADSESTYIPVYEMYGFSRRTTTNTIGSVGIIYGGSFSESNLTTPLVAPYDLMLTMNYNSLILSVSQNGVWKILKNVEVPIGTYNLQLATIINRLRPMVAFQTDGVCRTAISRMRVCANGLLGEREHVLATYENGEPMMDGLGNMYMSADNCHGTTASNTLQPTQFDSPYMRNQATMHKYNPDTGRFVRTCAKYVFEKGSLRFGAQEAKYMFDRTTGKHHLWVSEWNDPGDRTRLLHVESYIQMLHGHFVFPESAWEYVDLDFLEDTHFQTNDCYGADVIYWNGRWYLTATITGFSSIRTSFLISGTSPTTFDTLEYIDTETTEGSNFCRIGGTPHILVGAGPTTVKILSLAGEEEMRWTIRGGGRYPELPCIVPVMRPGRKTQYQIVTFSDTGDGLHPSGGGEDFYSEFNSQQQLLAFGSKLVLDGGTVDGEEFSPMPRRLVW